MYDTLQGITIGHLSLVWWWSTASPRLHSTLPSLFIVLHLYASRFWRSKDLSTLLWQQTNLPKILQNIKSTKIRSHMPCALNAMRTSMACINPKS